MARTVLVLLGASACGQPRSGAEGGAGSAPFPSQDSEEPASTSPSRTGTSFRVNDHGAPDGVDSPSSVSDAGGVTYLLEDSPETALDPATPPSFCESTTLEAPLVKRPIDFIVAIDNSASMEGEIVAAEESMSGVFAQLLLENAIDFQVIMVTRYGNVHVEGPDPASNAFAVCLSPPLGAELCPDSEQAALPAGTNESTRLSHHSVDIGSRNMWCSLTSSYASWGGDLRATAAKVFIGITDDSPGTGTTAASVCPDGTGFVDNLEGARAFDVALRELSSTHFGTAQERNFTWHSIIGMAASAGSDGSPLGSQAPVRVTCCSSGGNVTCPGSAGAPLTDGVRAGQGYQQLSILTGGLRTPTCAPSGFDTMFSAIAQSAVTRAASSCDYALNDPLAGTDEDDWSVTTSSSGALPSVLASVANAASCTGQNTFYRSGPNAATLTLCPEACRLAQAAGNTRLLLTRRCSSPSVP